MTLYSTGNNIIAARGKSKPRYIFCIIVRCDEKARVIYIIWCNSRVSSKESASIINIYIGGLKIKSKDADERARTSVGSKHQRRKQERKYKTHGGDYIIIMREIY